MSHYPTHGGRRRLLPCMALFLSAVCFVLGGYARAQAEPQATPQSAAGTAAESKPANDAAAESKAEATSKMAGHQNDKAGEREKRAGGTGGAAQVAGRHEAFQHDRHEARYHLLGKRHSEFRFNSGAADLYVARESSRLFSRAYRRNPEGHGRSRPRQPGGDAAPAE